MEPWQKISAGPAFINWQRAAIRTAWLALESRPTQLERPVNALASMLGWALAKVVFAAVLAALITTGVALALFLREPDSADVLQRESIRSLQREQQGLEAARVDAERRQEGARTQLAAQKLRATQAEKVAKQLEDLSGGMDWLTGDGAQKKENEQRLERMKQMETNSRLRVVQLEQELVRFQWEKDGIEIALQRNLEKRKIADTEDAPWLHYTKLAWADYRVAILIATGFALMIPFGWRVLKFWRS